MRVSIYHVNPRELYRVFMDVDRVEHRADPYRIELYSKVGMLAVFGPGDCWAIEYLWQT